MSTRLVARHLQEAVRETASPLSRHTRFERGQYAHGTL